MDDAASARQIIFQDCLHIFGVSFLFWDHLLTLGIKWRTHHPTDLTPLQTRKSTSYGHDESLQVLTHFSSSAISHSEVIFPGYFSCSSRSPKTCLVWSLVYEVTILAIQFVICCVILLRMYALYGRGRRLLCALVVVGIALMAAAAYNTLGQQATTITVLPGCHPYLGATTAYHLASTWVSLLIFDGMIFGLTVCHGWSTRRSLGIHRTTPLHTLIVRDGALYFGVMVLSNLANILTFVTNLPILPGSLATFATCISITMMMRLMLNLHEHAERGVLNVGSFPIEGPFLVHRRRA
ncbi:hypothetical protein DFH09DRAFT_128587 [Mycena vulgaris]|nr:hypothetical protein DFH09DRAFT_128587 [Mycena vulgaris]